MGVATVQNVLKRVRAVKRGSIVMNYEANTQRWHPGALVLHDKDRKEANMLMVVQGYNRVTGECITRYVRPEAYQGMRGRFKNDVRVLHDPARFGVQATREEA